MANAIPGGPLNAAPRIAVQSPHLNAVPNFGVPGFGGAAPVEQAPILNPVPTLQPSVPMPGVPHAYPGVAPQPHYGAPTGYATALPGYGAHPGTPLPTAPAVPPPPPTPPAPVVARLGAAPVAAPPPPPPPEPPAPPPYYVPAYSSANHRYRYRPPPSALASAPRMRAQPTTMVPPSCDLRGLFLPVRDAAAGHGRGYATAAWCEAMYALAAQAHPPDYFSAAYIADRAQAVSTKGASVAEEFAALVARGVPPEAFYPAPLLESLTVEHDAADIAATGFRAANPFQVDWSDVNGVKNVLAQQVPVVVAFLATTSFEAPVEGLLSLPKMGEPILGGHAVVLVGYDATGWIVRNSHGEAWGDKGYATMPYGYEGWWTEAWAASRAA